MHDDPFYEVAAKDSKSSPGTLLKLEKTTDTTKYLLPPSTALSRFIYQSETLSGSPVPVSAFILWPYSPRRQPDGGHPVVAWAHGTSGLAANTAPSHLKNLWQHYLAPYQIALQGYVVVGTDYAGLGVSKDGSGRDIMHEYLASPAQANDVVYSVAAAQSAFSELSKQFVVIGHSQGGGAAWSVAQKADLTPIPGYLGAVPISPYTKVSEEETDIMDLLVAIICSGMTVAFPEFKLSDMLTEEGENRVIAVHQTNAAVYSAMALLSGVKLLKPNSRDNATFRKQQQLTSNGGKPIAGPMLIIHGKADPVLIVAAVESAVKKTAEVSSEAWIEYVALPNVSHEAALTAAQSVWMDWIGDRFAGRELKPGCHWRELDRARPDDAYQADQNWYVEAATKPYHAPGP